MFRLAHISDPHLGPLPKMSLRELASKRITGYVNWQRNRRKQLFGDTLENLLASMHAASPDHIAITGDLVNLATRTEIESARVWLDTGFEPEHATLVPGNHDAYVPGALPRAKEAWEPWMLSDEPSPGAELFPSFRRRGPVALIGISSANPTLPFVATGNLKKKQARAAGLLLDRAREEGLFRVILIHHPPVSGAAKWHKRLRGIRRFGKMLRRHGAELVLHGHTHLDTLYHLDGRDGKVPVVGIASASNGPGNARPPAGFNLFDIDGGPGNWTILHRRMRLSGAGPSFEEVREGLIGGPDSKIS
ncbi:metallophosphoesterase family protein [Hoeflea olei]|uniref:Metallophosphatase n=1 Tax=Hoeflea olei TaxID=1480615 RepID=A0A1C1Z0A6_9HYPH|nr:metallophosphoesterase [Hoeflea olei]OCW59155.1 metallophosphatase [Hoeflea olei]